MILLFFSILMYVLLSVHKNVSTCTRTPNYFVGYRTKKAFKNKESWFAAQHFVQKLGKKTYLCTGAIGMVFSAYDLYQLSSAHPALLSLILQIMIYIATICIVVTKTEHFLSRKKV